MDKIVSGYKCDHCGKRFPGGLKNVFTHDNECPEKIVIRWCGDDVELMKRKQVNYVQSGKSRS